MDLAISLWEKNMIFACHTIAHGTNLRISPQEFFWSFSAENLLAFYNFLAVD